MDGQCKINFGLAEKAFCGRKIFKKHFQQNALNTRAADKFFNENVESVYLLYSLTPETTNIPAYEDTDNEYHEIHIIQVNLKTADKLEKTAELIQNAMPYPLVLLLCTGSSAAVNTAIKRKNKADPTKLTIEAMFTTPMLDLENPDENQAAFLGSLDVKNLSSINLYELYNDIVKRVRLLALCEYKNKYEVLSNTAAQKAFEIYDELKTTEDRIAVLKRDIKSASFNEQVRLNVEVNRLGAEILILSTQICSLPEIKVL